MVDHPMALQLSLLLCAAAAVTVSAVPIPCSSLPGFTAFLDGTAYEISGCVLSSSVHIADWANGALTVTRTSFIGQGGIVVDARTTGWNSVSVTVRDCSFNLTGDNVAVRALWVRTSTLLAGVSIVFVDTTVNGTQTGAAVPFEAIMIEGVQMKNSSIVLRNVSFALAGEVDVAVLRSWMCTLTNSSVIIQQGTSAVTAGNMASVLYFTFAAILSGSVITVDGHNSSVTSRSWAAANVYFTYSKFDNATMTLSNSRMAALGSAECSTLSFDHIETFAVNSAFTIRNMISTATCTSCTFAMNIALASSSTAALVRSSLTIENSTLTATGGLNVINVFVRCDAGVSHSDVIVANSSLQATATTATTIGYNAIISGSSDSQFRFSSVTFRTRAYRQGGNVLLSTLGGSALSMLNTSIVFQGCTLSIEDTGGSATCGTFVATAGSLTAATTIVFDDSVAGVGCVGESNLVKLDQISLIDGASIHVSKGRLLCLVHWRKQRGWQSSDRHVHERRVSRHAGNDYAWEHFADGFIRH
jgi:hypothetical protein